MISTQRFVANNPLVRRVQRHAAMTSLFREVESSPISSRTAESRGPVVQAILVQPPMPTVTDAPVPHSLPGSETGAHQVWSDPVSTSFSAEPVPNKETLASPPIRPVVPSPSSTPQAQAQRQEPTSTPKPARRAESLPARPRPQAETKTEDANWRRLQTILRKHDEKRESEAATEESTTSMIASSKPELSSPGIVTSSVSQASPQVGKSPTPNLQRQPDDPVSDLSSAPASTRHDVAAATPTRPPSESIVVSRSLTDVNRPIGGDVEAEQPMPDILPKTPEVGTAPAAGDETYKSKAPSPSSAETTGEAAVDKRKTVTPPSIASPVAAGTVQRAPGREMPADRPDVPGETGTASGVELANSRRDHGSDSALPEVPESELDEAVQPLPLEEVWPVQIGRPAQSKAPNEPPAAINPAVLDTEESPLPPEPVEMARVQATLQKVSAGKPTDSSIELIPPKGRKPGITSLQRSQEISKRTLDETPAASEPVQRQSAAGAPGAEPSLADSQPRLAIQQQDEVHHGQESAASTGQDGEPDNVQRKSGPGPESVQPATVSTEIGPLPADLWHYLGQAPPSSPTTPPPAADQAEPQEPVVEITPAAHTDAPVQRAFGGFNVPSLSDVSERASGAIESVRDAAPSGAESAIEAARGLVPTDTESALEAARGLVPSGAESAIDTARGLVPTDTESALEAARGLVPAGAESAIEAVRGLAPAGTESAVETARGLASNAADVTGSLAQQITEPAPAPAAGQAGTEPEQGEGPEESESAKSDLDKLARLVYGEIKRRLNLEKERGRGRF